MTDDDNSRVFDLDKLKVLAVESSQNLRLAKDTRRSKKYNNPDQYDLFTQPLVSQEQPHADANTDIGTVSSDRKIVDEHHLRQGGREDHPEPLADIRTATGGGTGLAPDAQKGVDPESGRLARPADLSGEDGTPAAVAGEDGSVANTDEARDDGQGSGRGRRSLRRNGYVSFAAADSEPVKPSRDYRITVESQIGEGNLRYKAERNLDAIQLLKLLEREGRQATEQEKHVLARYTGWGAMPAVFDTYTGRYDEWNAIRDDVRGLLTDDEYRAARASVSNAHYTSPLVVSAMWQTTAAVLWQPESNSSLTTAG